MRFVFFVTAAWLFFSAQLVFAQQSEIVDRSFSGVSKETNPMAAKKQIQDEAAEKISEQVIKEIIGEERFNKNKSRIASAIIKNYQRYIPFSKPSQIVQEGDEFKMSVELKISLKDLKQMLQSNALLNENDAVPVVLPLVSWTDRVQGLSYRWWLPSDKNQQAFLIKESRVLENALRNSFRKDNFYVIKPLEAGLGMSIPNDFHAEKLNSEDLQFFSQYFNAPVVIDGQIELTKGDRPNNARIEIRLNAIQVSNGKTIADVSRSFETDTGSYESVVDKKIRSVMETAGNDLASQVLDAWQRGTLGSSVIRLTIKGPNALPLAENLKSKIRSQITQVKNIHERLITSDSVSFELDTSIAGAELVNKLTALDLDGKKLSKVSDEQNEIVLSLNR
ncbi:MAG: hypothetical protein ACXVCP_00205 [Bdellovibrio sp.]